MRAIVSPHEDILLASRDLLHLDEFLDKFFERVVIERVFTAQHAQRHPAVFLQVTAHVADDVEQIHLIAAATRAA
jgi:hypothetical protein